jgi:hypothetical protein
MSFFDVALNLNAARRGRFPEGRLSVISEGIDPSSGAIQRRILDAPVI